MTIRSLGLTISNGKTLQRIFSEESFPLRIECNRCITSRRGDCIVGTVSIAGAGAVRCCIPAGERISVAGEAVGV